MMTNEISIHNRTDNTDLPSKAPETTTREEISKADNLIRRAKKYMFNELNQYEEKAFELAISALEESCGEDTRVKETKRKAGRWEREKTTLDGKPTEWLSWICPICGYPVGRSRTRFCPYCGDAKREADF